MDMVLLGSLVLVALWLVWRRWHGWMRASLALLLRVAWLAPFILAFFPQTVFEKKPESLSKPSIHVMVDDSLSMKKPLAETSIVQKMRENCQSLGCDLKLTRLSTVHPDVAKGYTPLHRSLEKWLASTLGQPWVLITDGGDEQPRRSWASSLRYKGQSHDGSSRGHILSLPQEQERNLWLLQPHQEVLAFVDKPLSIPVTLQRSIVEGRDNVQLQVRAHKKILASMNATFQPGDGLLELDIPLKPLAKGKHQLEVQVLPLSGEQKLWDNQVILEARVMADTIGVLHLLGAPSWDGRFVRRYIKSEPKHDLISFFILRDPGDVQFVNERELSLIPFPVDRLFNEELPNFKLVILQNFAMYQFLESSYNRNLAQFIKGGGGALFIGGPRAFQKGDLFNSVLQDMLPFKVKGSGHESSRPSFLSAMHTKHPSYDEKARFRIALAKPSLAQRELASLFDDWSPLIEPLSRVEGLKGFHRIKKESLKENVTPLLEAIDDQGQRWPLVLASYPDQGRAVWILSDALYRMALQPGPEGSRQLYQKFFDKAFRWLLRRELRQPIEISRFDLERRGEIISWNLELQGPALRYFGGGHGWHLWVCGTQVDLHNLAQELSSASTLKLSGGIRDHERHLKYCQAKMVAKHPGFGKVTVEKHADIPARYKDRVVTAQPRKLEALAQLTGAKLVQYDKIQYDIGGYLAAMTGQTAVIEPSRLESRQEHYWILQSYWFWILMLAMPLEVIVRRWPQLTAIKWAPKLERRANED